MAPVIIFLAKYWKQIGAAGVAVAIVFYIFTLRHNVEVLTANLDTAKAQIIGLENSNIQCTNAVKEQNNKIEQLKKEGDLQKQKLAVAITKANTVTIKYKEIIKQIDTIHIDNTCDGAIRALKDSAKDLSIWHGVEKQ